MMDSETCWMNVDTPTKTCTMHRVGCRYEVGKYEIDRKGIEELKEDGGWLSFESLPHAEAHYHKTYEQRHYALSLGCRCLTQAGD